MNILSAFYFFLLFFKKISLVFRTALNAACGSSDLCHWPGGTHQLSSSRDHHPAASERRSLVSLWWV